MLNRFFIIALLGLLAGSASYAQNEAVKKPGSGYLFVAPGVVTCCGGGRGLVQVGGGAEGTIHRGLGANADAGYMFLTDRAGAGVVTLSAGPAYQFNRSGKTVPFVTGGLSLAIAAGAGAACHVGGGVTHWMRPRWGLRFEVRDHIPPEFTNSHLVLFRVGLAIR